MNYQEFIEQKRIKVVPSGFDVPELEINPMMFQFQKDLTRWALRRGKAALFLECGFGKGQPYGSQILTPDGWINIEHLTTNHEVISSDGKSYPVTGVYPKQEIDTYEFFFSDRTSFIVDIDHLHIVRTNNERYRGKPWRVMSTRELVECGNLRYGKDGKSRNYDIPVVRPIEFSKKELPIDPYVMGVLLGDGCLCNGISISNPDNEIIERVIRNLTEDVTLNKSDRCDWNLVTGKVGNKKHWFRQKLHDMGLLGKLSNSKFIPRQYLFSNVSDRLELLRGLMDTDGYIENSCEYSTASHKLADDMMFLLRSLGGIPTRSLKEKPHYRDKDGNKIICQPSHRITFSLKTFNPFHLSRKAKKWNSNPRDNGRWIDRIEYSGKQKTVCISVDSPDNSYATEHMIVTHNTFCQLEWGKHIYEDTGKNVLIFAPLAVSAQTKREGEKFGINVNICKDGEDVRPGINITNYERLHHFDPDDFVGIVLDESSILKGQFGKIRKEITRFASNIPFRLACSATPAPNDWIELINHAEFFSIMTESEIKALFFTQDGNSSNKFRLKRYAEVDFWKWVAEWAIAMRMPSDLGYENGEFILPELRMHQHTVELQNFSTGMLFTVEAKTLTEQRAAAKASLDERVEMCADLVNNSSEPWIVWCNMNYESEALTKAIPDAVEIAGKHDSDYKESAMMGFTDGTHRVIVTKPSLAGFGMNWQHCSNMAYVGLSHSFEQFYQSVRRSWRFGQQRPVDVHIITSNAEGAVVSNIQRKEKQAGEMFDEIVRHMSPHANIGGSSSIRNEMAYDDNLLMEVPIWVKSYPESPLPVSVVGEFLYSESETMWELPVGWKDALKVNSGNIQIELPEWIQ